MESQGHLGQVCTNLPTSYHGPILTSLAPSPSLREPSRCPPYQVLHIPIPNRRFYMPECTGYLLPITYLPGSSSPYRLFSILQAPGRQTMPVCTLPHVYTIIQCFNRVPLTAFLCPTKPFSLFSEKPMYNMSQSPPKRNKSVYSLYISVGRGS